MPITVFQATALFVVSVLPFLALPWVTGWVRLFAGICALLGAAGQARVARHYHISLLYGLTHPLGALIFCYMLLRSTAITLWQGGIVWRDTFYPLDELRKGIV